MAAVVAASGVHEADDMPFAFPWTAGGPETRARTTFQHVPGTIAERQPEKWALSLAVLHEGEVVGRQDLTASDFAVTGEAQTALAGADAPEPWRRERRCGPEWPTWPSRGWERER